MQDVNIRFYLFAFFHLSLRSQGQNAHSTGIASQPHLIIYRVIIAALNIIVCQLLHLFASLGQGLTVRIFQYSLSRTYQQRVFRLDEVVGVHTRLDGRQRLVVQEIDTIIGANPDAL